MTSTAATGAPTASTLRGTAARLPAWNLLALIAGLGAVFLCAGPVSDPDVFWHVEVGAYTLHGHAFPFPDPWAYSLPHAHWHSTSWLSELVLAAVQRSSGWLGVVVLRVVVTVWVVAALYRLLVRGRGGWAGPAVYTLVVIPLTAYVQERPQTASLLFLVWLAGVCERYLAQRVLPRRTTFVALTYLWAMVHGLFVMAPVCLALLAGGALLDRGRRGLDHVRALLLTAVTATVACALTPMGPRLLLAPITVGSAVKGLLLEWLPTSLTTLAAWGFAGLLTALALSWARSRQPAPRSELLFVLVLAAFGFTAIRNAGPASVLLAPVAVRVLTRSFDTSSALTVRLRLVAPVMALGVLAVTASYLRWPVLPDARPATIGRVLAAQPGQLRVLNDYNVSGFLISAAAPHVTLVVDGRADRYGHAFLVRETDAAQGLKPWKGFVDEFSPQVAVIDKEGPLAELLVQTRGWHRVLDDNAYTLLTAPGVTLVMP